eukprot:TRINITY_DN7320_c0_g1_i2.p2 TRINITY_DN7320_c0_g1~~TRINITY_DN7320_c0_g1_i2.p2  ORF type:complete len:290 (-),score=32.35 TRINITY_DN7320_c0_g1_i2:182-1051(-)
MLGCSDLTRYIRDISRDTLARLPPTLLRVCGADAEVQRLDAVHLPHDVQLTVLPERLRSLQERNPQPAAQREPSERHQQLLVVEDVPEAAPVSEAVVGAHDAQAAVVGLLLAAVPKHDMRGVGGWHARGQPVQREPILLVDIRDGRDLDQNALHEVQERGQARLEVARFGVVAQHEAAKVKGHHGIRKVAQLRAHLHHELLHLIVLCFCEQLLLLLPAGWNDASAVSHEVEDTLKVLGIAVNEVHVLCLFHFIDGHIPPEHAAEQAVRYLVERAPCRHEKLTADAYLHH